MHLVREGGRARGDRIKARLQGRQQIHQRLGVPDDARVGLQQVDDVLALQELPQRGAALGLHQILQPAVFRQGGEFDHSRRRQHRQLALGRQCLAQIERFAIDGDRCGRRCTRGRQDGLNQVRRLPGPDAQRVARLVRQGRVFQRQHDVPDFLVGLCAVEHRLSEQFGRERTLSAPARFGLLVAIRWFGGSRFRSDGATRRQLGLERGPELLPEALEGSGEVAVGVDPVGQA